MNILVTGGAGYIGSVLCEELLKENFNVIVLDDLRQGHRCAVPEKASFCCIDICNKDEVDSVFKLFKIDAVLHMAAETVVEYSMTDPQRHFRTNVVGGINLLDTMLKYNVKKCVFSSTAAVYGIPAIVPTDEKQLREPVNAYGESKIMFENILKWAAKAYGMKFVIFRYFNAAGASDLSGEDHKPETHLIPNILKMALGQKKRVSIFGSDYTTKDGTCVRDYLHVLDIAQAHILALNQINNRHGQVFNLGNEKGYSVLDIVKLAEIITKTKIDYHFAPKREGDPPVLIADSQLARKELGWIPKYSNLETIIESSWNWMQKYPDGYKK